MLTALLFAMLTIDGGDSPSAPTEGAPPRREAPVTLARSGVGGAIAPAALGPGTIALYGLVGAPELAVGYRQGFSALEIEARFSFDLFEVAGLLELGAKVRVYEQGRLQLAIGGNLGLGANSGSTYADLGNFASWTLRPAAVGVLSYEASDIVALFSRLELPLAVSLDVHGLDFRPTLAVGGEVLLGQGVSLVVLGRLGLDAREDPHTLRSARAAWGIQLGVGYRVF
jgi:hypothetical protein